MKIKVQSYKLKVRKLKMDKRLMRQKVKGLFFTFLPFYLFTFLPVSAAETKKDEVFITLTRTAMDVEKLPTNTTVITHEEIQKSGAQNAGQAIDNVVSIYVPKTGQLGSTHLPRIRGFLNKQIVVYVDNRRVPRDVTGSVDLSQIPAESIDRIEIVRGAGSVLYGPDAEGGVIHIITKQAKGYLPTLRVSVQGESFNGQLAQVDIGMKKERAEGYFTASRNKSDNFQENGAFDNTSFSGNFGYDSGALGKAMVYFSHSKSQVGLPGGTTIPVSQWNGEMERKPQNQFAKQNDQNNSVQLEHKVNILEKADLTTRLAATEILRERLSTSTGPVTARSRGNRNSFYLQGDLNFGLTAGFEYINEHIRSPFSAVPQTNGYGLFVQQNFTYKSLTVIPGVRHDVNTEWGNTTNPRLSLVFQAFKWLKVSGNVGSGFQAPTFADLSDFDGITFAPIPRLPTAPALVPEKSWHYDIGAEAKPMENLSAKLTLYRADIFDRLRGGFTSDFSRFTTTNVQKAFNQGVEFELEHRLSNWLTHQMNYTYLQSEGKGEGFAAEFTEFSFVPRNRFNYLVRFFLPWSIEFGNTIKYVSEQFTGDGRTGTKLPDYWLWNIDLGWRWKEIELKMGINNLTERRYAEAGFTGTLNPHPGRTYWGSIAVKFL